MVNVVRKFEVAGDGGGGVRQLAENDSCPANTGRHPSFSSPVFRIGSRDFGAGTQTRGLQAYSGQGTRSRVTYKLGYA